MICNLLLCIRQRRRNSVLLQRLLLLLDFFEGYVRNSDADAFSVAKQHAEWGLGLGVGGWGLGGGGWGLGVGGWGLGFRVPGVDSHPVKSGMSSCATAPLRD